MGEVFYPYCDMHCDTLMWVSSEGNHWVYDGNLMQSLQQQYEGRQMLQFYAIFFRAAGMLAPADVVRDKGLPSWFAVEEPDDEAYYARLRDALLEQTAAHDDIAAMAYSAADVERNWAAGKVSAMLTLEDGRILGNSIERLHALHQDGVRAIALTWNHPNCLGNPNSREAEEMARGLTNFGIEAVQEMQRIGVLVDVSHLSDGGFRDVVQYTDRPFIASHSSCRALTNHPRNLTDEMIRTMAERGCVAGVNFGPEFVTPNGVPVQEETAAYVAQHVMHMIAVGGEDVAAIGTDMDGVDGSMEIQHPIQMQLLFRELERQGLTPRQIDKVASGNVLRVLRDTIG